MKDNYYRATDRAKRTVIWPSEYWVQQIVTLLTKHEALVLYPALHQCENASQRLTRWITHQLPRMKKAHKGCPVHRWLSKISTPNICKTWQQPEQWPNLYWLPLPDIEGMTQGGLVLFPALMIEGKSDTLPTPPPAIACIFWCVAPDATTLDPAQKNRAFCLPSTPEQINGVCSGLLFEGVQNSENTKRQKQEDIICEHINVALLRHICAKEKAVWMKQAVKNFSG